MGQFLAKAYLHSEGAYGERKRCAVIQENIWTHKKSFTYIVDVFSISLFIYKFRDYIKLQAKMNSHLKHITSVKYDSLIIQIIINE